MQHVSCNFLLFNEWKEHVCNSAHVPVKAPKAARHITYAAGDVDVSYWTCAVSILHPKQFGEDAKTRLAVFLTVLFQATS